MAYPSEPALLVLHALRLKGFAEAETIAATTEIEAASVDALLADLAGDDLVAHRHGRISGWSLTSTGRKEHAGRIEAELEASGQGTAVDGAYRRFLALNRGLLDVCTAWQMRPSPGGEPILNDHTDRAYDAAVIARLDAMHDGVRPICADLAGSLERFASYLPRFDTARQRVADGDLEWFTRPLIDSYHTIWFELHEDLLATLGLERKEGAT